VLEKIEALLGGSTLKPAPGERWFGDDAAVLQAPPEGHQVVICTDAAVAGVHCDLELVSPADLGWKAAIASISDLAAMGASPWCLVVTVAAPPALGVMEVMEGAIDAATVYACPIVGGDLTAAPVAMVSVAALGMVPSGRAVLRSGARAGDVLALTGELGGSAAGLEALRSQLDDHRVTLRHRRPVARVTEGAAALRSGAHAMIDISDGLSLDLHRMADASGVGFELDRVPVAPGASRAHALAGGEDYELLMATPDFEALCHSFADDGLELPLAVGRIVADPGRRLVEGAVDQPSGWCHDLS
jgi:thiamine-monophosphate kinase